MNAVTGLTLAGLTAVLIALIWDLRPWWAGNRDMKQLTPVGKGASLGVVSALCPGGILGWLHSHSGQAANLGGDKAMSTTTGMHATAPIEHRSLGGLDQPGAVVVVVIAVLVVLAWRKAEKKERWKIVRGTFVGSTLCLTAGVIGALTWLPGTLNDLGHTIQSAL